MKETLYEILGLETNQATPDEVKSAFRELSKSNHPDKGGSQSRQAEINHAYEVLSSPAKRLRYDETGQDRDVAADKKLHDFLATGFLAVMEHAGPVDTTDLIEAMKMGVQSMVRDTAKSILECIKREGKLNKVMKRLKSRGDKNIVILMERQLEGTRQEIKMHQEHRDFMIDVVLVVLEDYSYEIDEVVDDELTKFLKAC